MIKWDESNIRDLDYYGIAGTNSRTEHIAASFKKID
jgi:hypothetical protein